MCGICGHTRDADAKRALQMCARMVHRGPDDRGLHVDASTGLSLGAQRLSIIDLERGRQPLSNEDGTVWAVLNGEIYNHPSLRERLRRRGHTLASRTDTEVLVHLYEDFGDDFPHALEGMFAAAVWDGRRRRLLIVRDRYGEKPLFYKVEREGFVFASELTALRAGLVNDPEIDPRGVDAFFQLGYVPGPATIFRDVWQLPPGSLLEWREDRPSPTIRRYWRPPGTPGIRMGGREALAEVGRLLEESVRSRLVADVPVGVFLSGGVDSTLVAALARDLSGNPLRTFTIGYDVGSVGELAPARAAARRLGTEHHEHMMTRTDVARDVPRLLARIDQPVADRALPALHALAAFARPSVKVALGGEGADELFGGYPRYRWIARAAALDRRVDPRIARRAAAAVDRLPGGRRKQRFETLLRPQSVAARHVQWVTGERCSARADLYGPALAVASSTDLEHGLSDVDGEQVAASLARHDQTQWLPDDVLAKADRATMLASLELRTPYLHRELGDLASRLEWPAERRPGPTKRILREVLRRTAGIDLRRGKTAFRVPAADWLRGPLAGVLREQVETSSLYTEHWFERAAVRRALDEHADGRADRTEVLWPLLAFGAWLDALRGRDVP